MGYDVNEKGRAIAGSTQSDRPCAWLEQSCRSHPASLERRVENASVFKCQQAWLIKMSHFWDIFI